MDRRRQPETVFFVLFSVPSFVPNTPFKSLLGREVSVSRVPFGTSEIFSPTAPEESNFMFPKKKSTFSSPFPTVPPPPGESPPDEGSPPSDPAPPGGRTLRRSDAARPSFSEEGGVCNEVT
jgi:hypothetical protein